MAVQTVQLGCLLAVCALQLSLLYTCVQAVRTDVPWTNCGNASTDLLTVHQVQSDPWPPELGRPITFYLNSTLTKTVSGGQYEARLLWRGIPVFTQSGNICSLIGCPINQGIFYQEVSFDVPDVGLTGTVTLKLAAVDQNNTRIVCALANTTLAHPGHGPSPVVPVHHDTGEYVGPTRTILEFSRLRDTYDSSDNVIHGGTTRLLYALHPEDPVGVNNMQRHTVHGSHLVDLLGQPPRLRRGATFELYNYTIPNEIVPNGDRTQFLYKHFRVPQDRKRHIIRIEPVLRGERASAVQYMALHACGQITRPDDLRTCRGMPLVAAWGKGGRGFTLPIEAGIPFGPGFSTDFLLEVQYDNAELTEFRDSSGLRLFVSDDLRHFDAGLLQTGHLLSEFSIPAGSTTYNLRSFCPSVCTAKYIPPGGIHVFAGLVHTHGAGIGMRSQHISSNGTEHRNLNSNAYYTPEFQQTSVLRPPALLRPGDSLRQTCTYNTVGRTQTTQPGPLLTNEQCFNILYYYPRIGNWSQCLSSSDSALCGGSQPIAAHPPQVVVPYSPAPQGQAPPASPTVLNASAGIFNSSRYENEQVLHTNANGQPDMTLYWNVNDSFVEFAVDALTGGWVGVGFSDTGTMRAADIYMGWVDDANGLLYFTDRYANAFAMPSIDSHQDAFGVRGQQLNSPATSSSSNSRAVAVGVPVALLALLALAAALWWRRRARRAGPGTASAGRPARGDTQGFTSLEEDDDEMELATNATAVDSSTDQSDSVVGDTPTHGVDEEGPEANSL